MLVVFTCCYWDRLSHIFAHLVRNITANLDGNIKNNLVWYFSTLCVCLIHTYCVRNLLDGGGAGVPRHRGADRHLYVLRCLHWDLLANFFGDYLTPGTISTRGRPPTPAMVSISIGHGGVADLLVNWVTLGLILQIIAMLGLCSAFLLIHWVAVLVLNWPCSWSALFLGQLLAFLHILCLILVHSLGVAVSGILGAAGL